MTMLNMKSRNSSEETPVILAKKNIKHYISFGQSFVNNFNEKHNETGTNRTEAIGQRPNVFNVHCVLM